MVIGTQRYSIKAVFKSKYRQQKPNYDSRLLTTEIQSNHSSYSTKIKNKIRVILIH